MPDAEEFTRHLARVRERFAAALPVKVADSFAALEPMSLGGSESIEALVIAHRRLHEMCGIAPTLGFPAIGKAARSAEAVIRDAARHKRELGPSELAALRNGLEHLRSASTIELVGGGNG